MGRSRCIPRGVAANIVRGFYKSGSRIGDTSLLESRLVRERQTSEDVTREMRPTLDVESIDGVEANCSDSTAIISDIGEKQVKRRHS